MNKRIRFIGIYQSSNWRGRRLYLIGHRVHHGLTGCVFTVLGLSLAAHDYKDRKRWLKDWIREA